MLLHKGSWLGRGKVLVEGASVGERVELDVAVQEDAEGVTLSGTLAGEYQGNVSIRIAPHESGTYVVDARLLGLALDGIAKLESEPNHALLWNEAQTQLGSLSLWRISGGVGCRGFWRENGKVRTWEVLFKLKAQALTGGNVVSLRRRR